MILILFQAEKLFYKSNEMTEKLGKSDAKRKIGQCYTNLGLMYWQMGEIDKAIECSEKSIEVWALFRLQCIETTCEKKNQRVMVSCHVRGMVTKVVNLPMAPFS